MVMVAFVLSRVLGLVRDMMLGSAFGTGADMDAFRTASRVTDTLYILVAGGALGSAFIPTFTTYLTQGRRALGWKVASAVINLILLVTLTASLLTALIAPWLVSTVLAPGLPLETQRLSVSLLRWMLAATVIFGVSGLLMGILNANDHFLLPALAPSLYNLGIILGVALLAPRWGIHGVAIGTVIGALLHLLIQLPALRTMDWRYTPTLGLRLEGVCEIARLMGPRVLGLAITQLHFWVNINLGSHIGVEGVIAALTWGWLLMLLPQGIFGQAIATVILPAFSAQVARKEQAAMQRTFVSVLGAVIYLTLPATLGLILLRHPFVEMFFMRGRFGSQDAQMVAWALAWYAVGLVAHAALEIVTRAFYALHDTATPVWVGGSAMALNVILSLVLSRIFAWAGARYLGSGYQPWMPLGGLALANSVATILETATLTGLLWRRLGGLDGRALWASLWRIAAGTAVTGIALAAFLRLAPTQNAWILGGGGIALGGGAFVATTALLRSPEIKWAAQLVRRRLSRGAKTG